jgi:hypothetical protein
MLSEALSLLLTVSIREECMKMMLLPCEHHVLEGGLIIQQGTERSVTNSNHSLESNNRMRCSKVGEGKQHLKIATGLIFTPHINMNRYL